jgi:hypothetical protein
VKISCIPRRSKVYPSLIQARETHVSEASQSGSPHRRTRPLLALLFSAAALGVACGKGAAHEALDATSAAFEKAKPEIEKYVPDQLEALTEGLAKGRADFDKGDYKGALRAAQELVPRVQAAVLAAGRKRDELTAAFSQFRETLPQMAAALESRLARLATMTSLPSDLDQATVAAAKSNLETVTANWEKATESFDSGDFIAAVKLGSEAKTTLEEMTHAFIPRAAARKTAP